MMGGSDFISKSLDQTLEMAKMMQMAKKPKQPPQQPPSVAPPGMLAEAPPAAGLDLTAARKRLSSDLAGQGGGY